VSAILAPGLCFSGRKSKRRRRHRASAAAHSQCVSSMQTAKRRVKRWLPAVGSNPPGRQTEAPTSRLRRSTLAKYPEYRNLAAPNQAVAAGGGGSRFDQSDDFLATAEKVTLLEESTQAAFAGRRGHTGARAELKVAAGEIVEIVQVLDGVNRFRSARTRSSRARGTAPATWSAGPRARVTKPSVEGADTPPQAGEVAPAA
jgi:hypothetical protein